MDEQRVLENLKTGIRSGYPDHIQGFMDQVRDGSVRGVYHLVYPEIREVFMDPADKAASILCLICVAGGLLSITAKAYRFPSGLTGSPYALHPSEAPVLESLRIMRGYITDSPFIEKAASALGLREELEGRQDIGSLYSLVCSSLELCSRTGGYSRLQFMKSLIEQLSCPLKESHKESIEPAQWDAPGWHETFAPIWDSRVRTRQHAYRARYYQEHLDVVQKGVYLSQSGRRVEIPWDAYERMESSKMYREEIHLPLPERVFETKIEVWRMDCFQAAFAVKQSTEGRTAVLNLASRQNPGGGVYSGSGAQEESCFLRSDYFTALYPFAPYAEQYDLPRSQDQYPLDRDFGGVFSRDVTVFRGKESEGYPLLDEPWKTDFIAVAGINHPSVVEVGGELRLRSDMVQGTRHKIRTIFNIAGDNGVSNLILGALGCGAFHNPPKHVAELFREVLMEEEYQGRFQRLVFAITDQKLCDIFSGVFGCETKIG